MTAVSHPPQKRASSRFLFTDASNDALGVVIFANGRVEVHARHWSVIERPLRINVKEVVAACQGVIWLSPYEGEIIFLGVDNTDAFYDIIAGHAAHIVANECVGLMRRRCALALPWIPTELMPADGASRLVYGGLVNAKVVAILGFLARFAYLPVLK